MKYKFTLTFFAGLMLVCQIGFGQNAYRSKQTGANYSWTTIANWEMFDGISWVPATAYPTSAADVITISTADSITLSTAITIDQVVVDGVLAIFSSTQTLNDGAGIDLQVNGRMHMGLNGILQGAGTLQVNSSGTLSFLLSGARVRTVTTNNGNTVVSNPTGTTSGIENNTFTNNGIFTVLSGVFTINSCELVNNNSFVILSTSPNSYIQTSGTTPAGQLTNAATGTLNKPNTGSFSINRLANLGLIKGIGSLDVPTMPTNSGILEPGNSPGVIGVNANFFTSKTPTVNIEIADGTGAGIGHDQVNITGASSLAGTTINVTGNPAAPIGAYTILTADVNFVGSPTINVPTGYSSTINANNIVINKNTSLPVLWGEFNAFDETDNVRLIWSTVQEIDASHFEVEFSTDGSSFLSVSRIAAAGNSNVEKRYSFVHTSPSKTATNFYRIKQVDINGKYSYSKTVLVKLKGTGRPVVSATPNPVRNSLQIIAAKENFKMILTDLNGKTLKTLSLAKGSQYLDVSELSTGTYYILFSDGESSFSQKIVKMR